MHPFKSSILIFLTVSLHISNLRVYLQENGRTYWYGLIRLYEGWNFNSGNYLFTTDTK